MIINDWFVFIVVESHNFSGWNFLFLIFVNAMETSMYYWYTSNEHLPLSMCPLPFLSSQGFWELSVTHTQILSESMCFPWYVVSIDISVDEDGESYQFKGFNGRCSFEDTVVTPLYLGIFISIYSCTCTCTTILYCFTIFPSKLEYTNGYKSKSTLHIRISTNISLCTLC